MSAIEMHHSGCVTGRRVCPTFLPVCLWNRWLQGWSCRPVHPHFFLLRPSPASHHLMKSSIDSDRALAPGGLTLLPTGEVTQAYRSVELPGSHLDFGGSWSLISSPHCSLHPNIFFKAGNLCLCVWPKWQPLKAPHSYNNGTLFGSYPWYKWMKSLSCYFLHE